MSMDEGMIHEVGKYYPFAGLISTMDPQWDFTVAHPLPHKDGAGVGTTVPNEESLHIRISPALTWSQHQS